MSDILSSSPAASPSSPVRRSRPATLPSAPSVSVRVPPGLSVCSRSAPRRLEFTHACKIPSSTAQQRRMTANGGFLPPRTIQAKAFWQALMEKHAPPEPLTGPLSLIVIFYYQKKTKSLYKTTKPDLDNLMKMVQDAMQQTGYFVNDSQISILSVGKYYSSDFAGIRLSLEQLQEPEK